MRIQQKIIDIIIEHSKKELPYEACGYLAEKDGIVCKHYELTNMDRATDHFSMDPKEQFAAVKDMRELGLKLTAVYHSHPETPARPSAEDIRLAHDPALSYVIVSLADYKYDVKSFRVVNGEMKLESIDIVE